MQRVVGTGELVYGDRYVRAEEAVAVAEDDLGFAAALKLAIPAGLLIWAGAIWGAFQIWS